MKLATNSSGMIVLEPKLKRPPPPVKITQPLPVSPSFSSPESAKSPTPSQTKQRQTLFQRKSAAATPVTSTRSTSGGTNSSTLRSGSTIERPLSGRIPKLELSKSDPRTAPVRRDSAASVTSTETSKKEDSSNALELHAKIYDLELMVKELKLANDKLIKEKIVEETEKNSSLERVAQLESALSESLSENAKLGDEISYLKRNLNVLDSSNGKKKDTNESRVSPPTPTSNNFNPNLKNDLMRSQQLHWKFARLIADLQSEISDSLHFATTACSLYELENHDYDENVIKINQLEVEIEKVEESIQSKENELRLSKMQVRGYELVLEREKESYRAKLDELNNALTEKDDVVTKLTDLQMKSREDMVDLKAKRKAVSLIDAAIEEIESAISSKRDMMREASLKAQTFDGQLRALVKNNQQNRESNEKVLNELSRQANDMNNMVAALKEKISDLCTQLKEKKIEQAALKRSKDTVETAMAVQKQSISSLNDSMYISSERVQKLTSACDGMEKDLQRAQHRVDKLIATSSEIEKELTHIQSTVLNPLQSQLTLAKQAKEVHSLQIKHLSIEQNEFRKIRAKNTSSKFSKANSTTAVSVEEVESWFLESTQETQFITQKISEILEQYIKNTNTVRNFASERRSLLEKIAQLEEVNTSYVKGKEDLKKAFAEELQEKRKKINRLKRIILIAKEKIERSNEMLRVPKAIRAAKVKSDLDNLGVPVDVQVSTHKSGLTVSGIDTQDLSIPLHLSGKSPHDSSTSSPQRSRVSKKSLTPTPSTQRENAFAKLDLENTTERSLTHQDISAIRKRSDTISSGDVSMKEEEEESLDLNYGMEGYPKETEGQARVERDDDASSLTFTEYFGNKGVVQDDEDEIVEEIDVQDTFDEIIGNGKISHQESTSMADNNEQKRPSPMEESLDLTSPKSGTQTTHSETYSTMMHDCTMSAQGNESSRAYNTSQSTAAYREVAPRGIAIQPGSRRQSDGVILPPNSKQQPAMFKVDANPRPHSVSSSPQRPKLQSGSHSMNDQDNKKMDQSGQRITNVGASPSRYKLLSFGSGIFSNEGNDRNADGSTSPSRLNKLLSFRSSDVIRDANTSPVPRNKLMSPFGTSMMSDSSANKSPLRSTLLSFGGSTSGETTSPLRKRTSFWSLAKKTSSASTLESYQYENPNGTSQMVDHIQITPEMMELPDVYQNSERVVEQMESRSLDVLHRSKEDPSILLGWQIIVQDTNDANVAPGIYVITDLRKNVARQTEHRLSRVDGEDVWTKLRRSENKMGLNFMPLRKVIDIQ